MKKAGSTILRQIDILDTLNCIPHSIVLIDKNMRIMGQNRLLEALTGYSPEEAHGIQADYILRSNLSQLNNPLHTVLKTGETISVEGDIVNRNRKKIPIRFTISPLKNIKGKSIGIIISLEDISLLQVLDKKIHSFTSPEGIIGHSPKMQEIFELLPIISRTDASVLLTGETGTGKDLVAEAIHNVSKRARYPFIKINCGALPESLLESELFGHVHGAFTGAAKDKPGMFRLAHNGTIFLTEIGDLPLPLQVKLLTVLDDKEFYPLGSSKKVRVDVRVITGTHRNLGQLVKQGKFREDLFFRLNVLRLHLPSLRERAGDIQLLLDYFLKMFSADLEKNVKGFSSKSLTLLANYPYPGNVRELRNIVEHAVNICQTEIIQPHDMPQYVLAGINSQMKSGENNETGPLEKQLSQEISLKGSAPVPEDEGWENVEKRIIMEALIKTGGKRAQAAEMLGWGRSTLWRKIKRHGLE
jgi:two-component system response regulator AtoC